GGPVDERPQREALTVREMERLGRAEDERRASALFVRGDEAVEDHHGVERDDDPEADHRQPVTGEMQPHQPPLRGDEDLLLRLQGAPTKDLRSGRCRRRFHVVLLPPRLAAGQVVVRSLATSAGSYEYWIRGSIMASRMSDTKVP